MAERWKPPRCGGSVRTLVIVFGDQLDAGAAVLRSLDPQRDALLMMEVDEESLHVPSHVQRTVLFLSAMRHFADRQVSAGRRVEYVSLTDPDNRHGFEAEIRRAVQRLKPERLAATLPGEWRVLQALERAAEASGCPLTVHEDEHFLTTREAFAGWMAGRRQPILEHFYRWTRKRLDLLIDSDGEPIGGAWNFDKDNREAFRSAPQPADRYRPRRDAITAEVCRLVSERFGDNPGELAGFAWPVTPGQARRQLDRFIAERLPDFGRYQDAMWTDEPFLNHSLLSPALNLKLLDPRDCVRAAIDAFEQGAAPLPAVEGFVRQIVGWREFIRGIYWHSGPDYATRNGLDQHRPLPVLYWSGETEMACMRQSLGQVLAHGYGHHIQRLMVTGNFALLAGVDPKAISDWYLGMYVDAVDWVTLPNTLGMVMHADGGVVGTKPYAASGRYIARMSNYCDGCRFDPGRRTGSQACPFTTLYWDFLLRNERRFRDNGRMRLMLRSLERIDAAERSEIRAAADALREELVGAD